MSTEELKRELEKLTREQSELRQRAEDLARQMQTSNRVRRVQQGSQSSQGSTEFRQGARVSRVAAASRPADARCFRSDAQCDRRSAAAGSDVSRGSLAAAGRALEALRSLERQMQSNQPDERRRAVGDMQLEARQLADAQRQVASELGKAAAGAGGKDAIRRLAGEEERLADRARRLQESMKRLGPERGSRQGSRTAGCCRSHAEVRRRDAVRRRSRRRHHARDNDAAGAGAAD